MKKINMSVDIWEVNRYDFTVEVDENIPEDKQTTKGWEGLEQKRNSRMI